MIKYKKSKILKSKLINKDKRGFFETLFDDDIRNVSLLRSNKNSIRSNQIPSNYNRIFLGGEDCRPPPQTPPPAGL